jgi:hypothetical protein
MERLEEKAAMVTECFSRQYYGHVNHRCVNHWSTIGDLIKSYRESCESVLERMKRQKLSIAAKTDCELMVKLQLDLLLAVEAYSFPVSKFFKAATIQWLTSFYEENAWPPCCKMNDLISKSPVSCCEKDSKYAFKNYCLSDDASVTLLEENTDPMGNADGTTGLITWQGAMCLYNWVATNASWLLAPNSKVNK